MGQGLTNQITNSVPGHADGGDLQPQARAGRGRVPLLGSRGRRRASTRRPRSTRRSAPGGRPSPRTRSLICRSPHIDVIIDVTGSVEFGANVFMEAFDHGKHVVMMNAEVDATIGPILQTYAKRAGVTLSACDGDEPGLQMNLVRWVAGLGLIPRVVVQHQGPPGSVPQPDDAAGVGRAVGAEPGDGHVVRRRHQDQLRADDRRQRHRVQGAAAGDDPRARCTTGRSWTSSAATTSTSSASSVASSTTPSARPA